MAAPQPFESKLSMAFGLRIVSRVQRNNFLGKKH
jgi:hypothetical protein